jgi:Domain of unknown function (DU1801)
MAEIKTVATAASVDEFIAKIDDEKRRAEAISLREIMERVTGFPAVMWGGSIIGFGSFAYKSAATGRGGDWMKVGFSPRKAAISLYGLRGAYEEHTELAENLGKHTSGKGCLYLKHLSDADPGTLEALIAAGMSYTPDYAV